MKLFLTASLSCLLLISHVQSQISPLGIQTLGNILGFSRGGGGPPPGLGLPFRPSGYGFPSGFGGPIPAGSYGSPVRALIPPGYGSPLSFGGPGGYASPVSFGGPIGVPSFGGSFGGPVSVPGGYGSLVSSGSLNSPVSVGNLNTEGFDSSEFDGADYSSLASSSSNAYTGSEEEQPDYGVSFKRKDEE